MLANNKMHRNDLKQAADTFIKIEFELFSQSWAHQDEMDIAELTSLK
jgi:hypothetical protein